MDKRLIMIAVILVFGYIGVSSDSHGADTYNSMVPGFFDNAIDESKLFLVLLIVLVSCYLLKSKELALFYRNKENPNSEENNSEENNSEETNSEENSSSDCIDGTTTETPSEQQDITEDKIASEDVIKEKYGIDEN